MVDHGHLSECRTILLGSTVKDDASLIDKAWASPSVRATFMEAQLSINPNTLSQDLANVANDFVHADSDDIVLYTKAKLEHRDPFLEPEGEEHFGLSSTLPPHESPSNYYSGHPDEYKIRHGKYTYDEYPHPASGEYCEPIYHVKRTRKFLGYSIFNVMCDVDRSGEQGDPGRNEEEGEIFYGRDDSDDLTTT